MKKENSNISETVVTVLLFPVILLFLLCLLIVTPFDYLKYKRSFYYKDTHEKYSWLCTSSSYIKLYDLIKNEKLPVDYYRCDDVPITGYGFFIYKDTLILNDYEPCYDAEQNTWTVEMEDVYVDMKEDVAATIKRCNSCLKYEACKKAIVLIDSDVYNEHPGIKYEIFEFIPVFDGDIISALKSTMN